IAGEQVAFAIQIDARGGPVGPKGKDVAAARICEGPLELIAAVDRRRAGQGDIDIVGVVSGRQGGRNHHRGGAVAGPQEGGGAQQGGCGQFIVGPAPAVGGNSQAGNEGGG